MPKKGPTPDKPKKQTWKAKAVPNPMSDPAAFEKAKKRKHANLRKAKKNAKRNIVPNLPPVAKLSKKPPTSEQGATQGGWGRAWDQSGDVKEEENNKLAVYKRIDALCADKRKEIETERVRVNKELMTYQGMVQESVFFCSQLEQELTEARADYTAKQQKYQSAQTAGIALAEKELESMFDLEYNTRRASLVPAYRCHLQDLYHQNHKDKLLTVLDNPSDDQKWIDMVVEARDAMQPKEEHKEFSSTPDSDPSSSVVATSASAKSVPPRFDHGSPSPGSTRDSAENARLRKERHESRKKWWAQKLANDDSFLSSIPFHRNGPLSIDNRTPPHRKGDEKFYRDFNFDTRSNPFVGFERHAVPLRVIKLKESLALLLEMPEQGYPNHGRHILACHKSEMRIVEVNSKCCTNYPATCKCVGMSLKPGQEVKGYIVRISSGCVIFAFI
ncbi:MAG: hypothetical protein GY938_06245 [Ketobacter sp.]|nr:hypothetical protein [Ketobacter sp.]